MHCNTDCWSVYTAKLAGGSSVEKYALFDHIQWEHIGRPNNFSADTRNKTFPAHTQQTSLKWINLRLLK